MTDEPGTIHEALELRDRGHGMFTARCAHSADRMVVFGGQQIGQAIVAAALTEPAKSVRQVHAAFLRTGTIERPVEIGVRTAHSGRTLSTLAVTVKQEDRLLSESLVMMDAGDTDTLTSDPPAPSHSVPDVWASDESPQVVMVGEPDLGSTASGGPAELDVWTRWPDVDDAAPEVAQALLGWNTVPYLISAAMRPHEGFGIGMAHREISTGVLSHSLTFHGDPAPGEWQLVANRSIHAGHGRTYGVGNVFDAGGRLLASFAQENMVRALVAGPDASPATVM